MVFFLADSLGRGYQYLTTEFVCEKNVEKPFFFIATFSFKELSFRGPKKEKKLLNFILISSMRTCPSDKMHLKNFCPKNCYHKTIFGRNVCLDHFVT
jgi:hypothetical protein